MENIGSIAWFTYFTFLHELNSYRYYSLGSVTRTGHLVDDPKSNTYRAVRYVGPASTMGNILFAEFTAVTVHGLKASFRTVSRAFPSPAPPLPRRAA